MTEEVPLAQRQEIRVQQWAEDRTDVYSDGSRVGGAAAAGTTKTAQYLCHHATIMDAEMLGISLGLELGDTRIASDS